MLILVTLSKHAASQPQSADAEKKKKKKKKPFSVKNEV